ncbi:Actin-binding FH2 [Artemisia annua]|uniref:Actin-binding FH2 n=1 Tax=Artemisia annua TaxID=35608 RepID=A0A2U1M9R5_ARTAN|nr:Actin-binding FH2 [Artemisia annua]
MSRLWIRSLSLPEATDRLLEISEATQRSNVKLLQWNKVTRPLQGSLWEELQRPGEPQSAPDFDVLELEKLFSAVVPKKDTFAKKLELRQEGPVSFGAVLKPVKQ